MRKTTLLTSFFAAAIFLSVSSPAFTAGTDYSTKNIYDDAIPVDKPVMVIRFNSANVYYQMPLYNVVKKALQIYPGAFFELVSVIPSTGSFKQDEASTAEAHENARKVAMTLDEMGLPKGKYDLSYTTSAEATYNELQIFVR